MIYKCKGNYIIILTGLWQYQCQQTQAVLLIHKKNAIHTAALTEAPPSRNLFAPHYAETVTQPYFRYPKLLNQLLPFIGGRRFLYTFKPKYCSKNHFLTNPITFFPLNTHSIAVFENLFMGNP